MGRCHEGAFVRQPLWEPVRGRDVFFPFVVLRWPGAWSSLACSKAFGFRSSLLGGRSQAVRFRDKPTQRPPRDSSLRSQAHKDEAEEVRGQSNCATVDVSATWGLRRVSATCNGGNSASVLHGKLASASPPTLTAHNVATAMASHKRLARAASLILV